MAATDAAPGQAQLDGLAGHVMREPQALQRSLRHVYLDDLEGAPNNAAQHRRHVVHGHRVPAATDAPTAASQVGGSPPQTVCFGGAEVRPVVLQQSLRRRLAEAVGGSRGHGVGDRRKQAHTVGRYWRAPQLRLP